MISIDNSSLPFRALLGAILSVVKKIPVGPTNFSPNIKLDTIDDGGDGGPLPEDNIDGRTVYSASSGEEMANSPPNTRSSHCAGQRKAESGVMVCPMLPVACSFPLLFNLLDHLVSPKFP